MLAPLVLLTCAALIPCGSAALHVSVDLASAKHAFGGIGGISGGGATSALLRSYPRQQRDQILDLLFNRSFAAALPILKVESACIEIHSCTAGVRKLVLAHTHCCFHSPLQSVATHKRQMGRNRATATR